jgi:large subunit ribosomal protein L23
MDVLIKPLITEKMTDVSEKMPNRFGFIVNKKANKLQIKKAVEELYGVQVSTVNTMVYQGKQRSRMTKSGFISGRTNAYKKAVVTLIEGETIDFYSNI